MVRLIHTAGLTSCMAVVALGLTACATTAPPPVSRASLTSAELSTMYADGSSSSIRKGAYGNALELADRGVAFAPRNASAHYDRAVALQHLMRTNDAIAAYRLAESLFPREDVRGRSLAIYGVARALDDAGRCAGASAAYDEFAAFVERSDPGAAAMARDYARECGQAHLRGSDALASEMANAVVDGEYDRALRHADIAAAVSGAPGDGARNPWVDYNRGVALSELGRTDDALRAFESAEIGFSSDEGALGAGHRNAWGKSIAVYGRARALDNAGRCSEASKAYRQYATLAPGKAQAQIALATSKKCKALVGPEVMTTR